MELVINIATKVILYFVIAGIVKAVINKFFENDDFVVSKDYKSIEINRKFFAKVYFFIGLGFTIIFIIASSFPSNIEGKTKFIVFSIMIGFIILIYIVSLCNYLWLIRVDEEKVYFRNSIGKVREYNNIDIDYMDIDPNYYFNYLVIYYKDGDKFKIPYSEDQFNLLILLNYSQRGREKGKPNKKFTMEVRNFYKVLGLICVIGSIVMLVIIYYADHIFGIVFGGTFLVCAIIDFINKMQKEINVTSKSVVLIRPFRKNKRILLKNIKYIKRREIDNAEMIYLYSDKGLELKVSKLYENAHLFEDVIKRRNWIEK